MKILSPGCHTAIVLLVLALYTQQAFAALQLTAANPNATSLVFSWNSDVFSAAVESWDGTKLYALFFSSDSVASIVTMDMGNPLAFVADTIELKQKVSSLSGVLDEDLGFTSTLAVFAIQNGTVVRQSVLGGCSAVGGLFYGPAKNSVVVMCDNSSILYVYKPESGLLALSTASASISPLLAIGSRHDTLLYSIVSDSTGYNLQVFDYVVGQIRASVRLPDNFQYSSTTTQMLLSYSETYLVLYSNPLLLLYQVDDTSLSLVANLSQQFSALAAHPQNNTLLAKDGQTTAVYAISMETGTIIDRMSIPEKDYFNRIYVRSYDGKTVVIFTNYLKWYAYYLDSASDAGLETKVNGYVIVLSVILSLGMIVSVIYLICKPKGIPDAAAAQPQSQASQDSGARLAVPRRDAYQGPVPRTLETHNIATDMNESAINLSHGNEGGARRLVTCPLTGVTFRFPVVAADGYTYEKDAIEAWFRQNNVSPSTQETLENKTLIANKAVANYLTGLPSPAAH